MKYIIAILLFSIIILFHELGHFLLAKRAGVQVHEFALGLGPTLVGKKIGETKFCIKALPLGGCCVMEGEDEESKSKDAFCNKSVLDRALIVAAGPIFNFILALIFSIMIIGLFGVHKPVVDKVMPDSAAQEAGIKDGDIITAINGKRIYYFKEISAYNALNQGKSAEMDINRNGETLHVTVNPKKAEDGLYYYGLQSSENASRCNPIECIGYGLWDLKYMVSVTFKSLGMLIGGSAKASDISGPIGIVKVVGDSVSGNLKNTIADILSYGALISANLGVMNLLPIPALDGGRLFFLLIEKIRGEKANAKLEGMVNAAFLFALCILMVFVFASDILKIASGAL